MLKVTCDAETHSPRCDQKTEWSTLLSPLPAQRKDQQGKDQLNVTSARSMCAGQCADSSALPQALHWYSFIKYPYQQWRTIAAVIFSPERLASSRQWAHKRFTGEDASPLKCAAGDKSVTPTFSHQTKRLLYCHPCYFKISHFGWKQIVEPLVWNFW